MTKVFLGKIKDGKVIYEPVVQSRLNDYCKIHFGEVMESKPRKAKRSDQQNKALHLYFQMIADELNNGGYDVQTVIKEKIAIDWTLELVKDLLWRTAQERILKKKSTTELRKGEDIDKVYDHLTRHLGEKFGIFVEFPNNPNKDEFKFLWEE